MPSQKENPRDYVHTVVNISNELLDDVGVDRVARIIDKFSKKYINFTIHKISIDSEDELKELESGFVNIDIQRDLDEVTPGIEFYKTKGRIRASISRKNPGFAVIRCGNEDFDMFSDCSQVHNVNSTKDGYVTFTVARS